MYYRPADWRLNKTIWTAWPWDEALWHEDLLPAQAEFLALLKALKDEDVVVLAPDQKVQSEQAKNFVLPRLSWRVCSYADVWLRDTLPIVVQDKDGKNACVRPVFNGWGHKYLFPSEKDLSARIAGLWSIPQIDTSLTFEGGAIECDGLGTLITTEDCLLNDNRNPGVKKSVFEKEFGRLFGAQKIIWLKGSLQNDHTDGHVDTLARFIAPETIAIMMPENKADPNYQVLINIKEQILNETDALKSPFRLVELPSAGVVRDKDGQIMPASFLNYLRADRTMVVPLYGTPHDDKAVLTFKHACPDLNVVGLKAKAILSGGGAFHCLSQEYFKKGELA